MSKNILRLCIAILVSAISVQTQSQIDQPAAQLTTEERVAKNKRLGELLRHPTFITLRLVANPRDFSHGNSSDASTAYTVDDWISFQLFVTQSLSENISITNFLWPFHEYRPELYKDGDLLPFSKEAQKNIEIAERTPPSGSMIEVNLVPNREHQWARVTLDDWYERLGAGHYQLSVRKRFAWDGDWVESNPVIFDVVPRKVASPIPTGVSVEMVPDGYQDKPKQKSYRLSGEGYISVVVVNDSDLELFVPVIDIYYGNRPQLFKDGVLLPYLDETMKLINSKEEDSRRVELGRNLSVPQHTKAGLQVLDLRTWYGQLGPGKYKLINRRRFEIDGPWTTYSPELLFEIVR